MENSYLIFAPVSDLITINRFHICTWEFNNNRCLIEFGCEVDISKLDGSVLNIEIYIPWITKSCKLKDLYSKLQLSENSKFIFNDSVKSTISLDGGSNKQGVIHEFSDRNKLAILPVDIIRNEKDKILRLTVDLYNYRQKGSNDHVYFRFCIEPKISMLSTRKTGITKSTFIYDLKINEKRNIPEDLLNSLRDKIPCKIETCFYLAIVPNNYDLSFFDSSILKSVRSLENLPFNKYLGDDRVKKDELMVIFNKRNNSDTYSFFLIFTKERIGAGQFALAVLINLISGILLYLPSIRQNGTVKFFSKQFWNILPTEIYIACLLGICTILYFIWPIFRVYTRKFLK